MSSFTRTLTCTIAVLLVSACTVPPVGGVELKYDVRYHADFQPEQGVALARIHIKQGEARLLSLDLAAPADRFSDFSGDGTVQVKGNRVLWEIPATGGELQYRVVIDHRRNGAFDARMTDGYAIFRLDDLFPRAKARSRKGARSRSSLTLEGPQNWSFETPYGPLDSAVAFSDSDRAYDRPTGWAIAGELGIRRGVINDRPVAVAAPVGDPFRRLDTLAFLHWTLPELIGVFPQFPARLLIVGAGNDFWLGGLSGPGSLFLHSERPMISENSTSSLLHELVHVATSSPPAPGDDWILEGIAEYYAIVLLARSGGISVERRDRAFDGLASWATEKNAKLTDPSTGADTARAALLFLNLSKELDAAGSSIDALVADLFDSERADRHRLEALARKLLGGASPALTAAYAELN